MKRSWLVIGGIVFLLLVIVFWWTSTRNGFVTKEVAIKKQMGNLNAAYQERYDLIPRLVETVKGSVQAERGTLEAVQNARSRATGLQLTPEALKDPNLFANFQKVQDGLSNAISRLMVVTENYPDLKSQANFSILMSQIEGQEHRIKNERRVYNDAVQDFNASILRFPGSIIAGSTFTPYEFFQGSVGSENAPDVKFTQPNPETAPAETAPEMPANPKGPARPAPAKK